jgi:pantetheine-phosphate adenylyltransferase
MTNSHLHPDVDTIFIACASKYYFVSSSGVKEAALLGGSVTGLVPPLVESRLKEIVVKMTSD